jgi:hypothetical protein
VSGKIESSNLRRGKRKHRNVEKGGKPGIGVEKTIAEKDLDSILPSYIEPSCAGLSILTPDN